MTDEQLTLLCPSCHAQTLSVLDYESLLVLKRGLALFTIRCPRCNSKISMIRPIPPILRKEVNLAAAETGAGMGRIMED